MVAQVHWKYSLRRHIMASMLVRWAGHYRAIEVTGECGDHRRRNSPWMRPEVEMPTLNHSRHRVGVGTRRPRRRCMEHPYALRYRRTLASRALSGSTSTHNFAQVGTLSSRSPVPRPPSYYCSGDGGDVCCSEQWRFPAAVVLERVEDGLVGGLGDLHKY
jgi:hypothetical protein